MTSQAQVSTTTVTFILLIDKLQCYRCTLKNIVLRRVRRTPRRTSPKPYARVESGRGPALIEGRSAGIVSDHREVGSAVRDEPEIRRSKANRLFADLIDQFVIHTQYGAGADLFRLTRQRSGRQNTDPPRQEEYGPWKMKRYSTFSS